MIRKAEQKQGQNPSKIFNIQPLPLYLCDPGSVEGQSGHEPFPVKQESVNVGFRRSG